jgi:hypothetical protein
MKTGHFVSLIAALALMISIPTAADAVGLGKMRRFSRYSM